MSLHFWTVIVIDPAKMPGAALRSPYYREIDPRRSPAWVRADQTGDLGDTLTS
jgi:hypothetical protein